MKHRRTSAARKNAARPVPTRTTGNRSDTQTAILAAARDVLITQGNSRMTLRRVADAAGITVGNLTYHFASKRQLLRALIEDLIAGYGARVQAFFNDRTMSPSEEFSALIEWLINDSASRATSRVFRELWAMALNDAHVARALDDFYDEILLRGADLLRRSQPRLTDSSAGAIVHLLSLISEGANVIYGTRTNRATSLQAVIALAVQLLGRAVQVGGIESKDAGAAPGTKKPRRTQ
jgi:AcrR family transcriptional regulator